MSIYHDMRYVNTFLLYINIFLKYLTIHI